MEFDPKAHKLINRGLGILLRLFFKLLYNQFAWTYDLVAATVSRGRWTTWVSTALPYFEDKHPVLELGHGPGHLLLAGRKQGIQIFGLDASPNMGRIAYHRLQKEGFSPDVIYGYAQYIPFASKTFEGIVATFPSEYIAHSLTIAEIVRVLKPGGTLVIIPAAWIEGQSLPDRLLASLFRISHQVPSEKDQGPVEAFTSSLTDEGLRVAVNHISSHTSKVLLIEARKPGKI